MNVAPGVSRSGDPAQGLHGDWKSALKVEVLSCVPFQALFRGLIVEQAVALYHVQLVCVWGSEHIDHGEWPIGLDARWKFNAKPKSLPLAQGIPSTSECG